MSFVSVCSFMTSLMFMLTIICVPCIFCGQAVDQDFHISNFMDDL